MSADSAIPNVKLTRTVAMDLRIFASFLAQQAEKEETDVVTINIEKEGILDLVATLHQATFLMLSVKPS